MSNKHVYCPIPIGHNIFVKKVQTNALSSPTFTRCFLDFSWKEGSNRQTNKKNSGEDITSLAEVKMSKHLQRPNLTSLRWDI